MVTQVAAKAPTTMTSTARTASRVEVRAGIVALFGFSLSGLVVAVFLCRGSVAIARLTEPWHESPLFAAFQMGFLRAKMAVIRSWYCSDQSSGFSFSARIRSRLMFCSRTTVFTP